jgi:hypothetical protein
MRNLQASPPPAKKSSIRLQSRLCPAWSFPLRVYFFGAYEHLVDEAFTKVEFAARAVAGERPMTSQESSAIRIVPPGAAVLGSEAQFASTSSSKRLPWPIITYFLDDISSDIFKSRRFVAYCHAEIKCGVS